MPTPRFFGAERKRMLLCKFASLQSVLVCEKTRRTIGGDVSDNSVNSPVQEVMPNLIKNNGTSIAESPSFQLTMAAAKREKTNTFGSYQKLG